MHRTDAPNIRLLLLGALYLAAVWVIAWYAGTALPSNRLPPPPPGPVAALSAWDGTHYLAIAQHGYTTETRRLAFFPLFPALARLFGGEGHAALAGILLSQALLLACLLLLRHWRGEDSAPGLRGEPGFWLLLSPFAFFMAALYAESLFLLLTLLALLAARRARTAASAGALLLAGLARPTAVCLPALFAGDVAHARDRRRALLLALAPLAGVALYLAFVAFVTGDVFGYTHVQSELWRHRWAVPFAPALGDARTVIASLLAGYTPRREVLIRLCALGTVLALLLSGWKRLEPPLRAYLVLSLLFIHAQLPDYSSARYDLSLFPVFVLVARTRFVRGTGGWVLMGACALIQLAFLLDFLTWRWVG